GLRCGCAGCYQGQLVAKPAGETGHAWPIQQPGDRHHDAQVAFNLYTHLPSDERVDAEAAEGCPNVQARWGQIEFAGSEIAQVRLEQPLALLRCCIPQRVVEAASRPRPIPAVWFAA